MSEEKVRLAGAVIAAMLYGVVVPLFFQCISASLSPANPTRGNIKWKLVAHTAAIFTFITIFTAVTLNSQSEFYIDNREFPRFDGTTPPPITGSLFDYSKAIGIVSTVTFVLNSWLSDGLLLYRCYIIYAMDYRVVVVPFLMYLVSLAMGSEFINQSSRIVTFVRPYASISDFCIACCSASLLLHVLLTLMIAARLIQHGKNIQNTMGAQAGPLGLYQAIATILVESCALRALAYLLFIVSWAASSSIVNIFFPVLAETQVIASFLITLRVANKSALTSKYVVSGSVGSSNRWSQDLSTVGEGTLVDEYPMSPVGSLRKIPAELEVRVETTVDFCHDE